MSVFLPADVGPSALPLYCPGREGTLHPSRNLRSTSFEHISHAFFKFSSHAEVALILGGPSPGLMILYTISSYNQTAERKLTNDQNKEPYMNNELLGNLDEVEAWDELFTIRSKRTDGIDSVLRRNIKFDENMTLCVYLFETRSDAIKYLAYEGKTDPDQWDAVSCNEFGGIPSFLKQASSFATHVAVDPPSENVPVPTFRIKDAIRAFESVPASGRRQTPFWELVLKKNKYVVYALEDETWGKIFPLFRTDMDVDEFINSRGFLTIGKPRGP
jgi:hypothetical protein